MLTTGLKPVPEWAFVDRPRTAVSHAETSGRLWATRRTRISPGGCHRIHCYAGIYSPAFQSATGATARLSNRVQQQTGGIVGDRESQPRRHIPFGEFIAQALDRLGFQRFPDVIRLRAIGFASMLEHVAKGAGGRLNLVGSGDA